MASSSECRELIASAPTFHILLSAGQNGQDSATHLRQAKAGEQARQRMLLRAIVRRKRGIPREQACEIVTGCGDDDKIEALNDAADLLHIDRRHLQSSATFDKNPPSGSAGRSGSRLNAPASRLDCVSRSATASG
jgi:hypothetical protein